MTIIESVQRFLLTCPQLSEGKLNVDFLPPEAAAYSVDVVPVNPVIKRYMDGATQRQFLFVLASRTYYGDMIRQQLNNLGFFEKFSDWLETQNRAKNYPDLGDNRTVRKLEVTTSGYVFAPETNTARYQIQCRLEYFQKGDR